MERQSLLNGDMNNGSRDYKPFDESPEDLGSAQLKPWWRRWHRTQVIPALVLVMAGFLELMAMKMIGPSLLDLQLRTGSSLERVSWFMSAVGAGAMMGSLLLGKFLDRPSRWLQISTAAILSGLLFAITPWFTNFFLQLLCFALFGITNAYTLTGAQLTTYCLFDYYVDSVRWQNVYQIALGVGGMFGPILVQPFLLEIPSEIPSEIHSEMHSNNSGNVTSNPPGPADVKIMYAFLVTGSLLVLTGIAAITVHLAFGTITVYHSIDKAKAKNKHPDNSDLPKKLKWLKMAILVLLFLYYFSQSMPLRNINIFLVPFCVGELGWSKTKGANLTAAYFGFFAIGVATVFSVVSHVSVELLVNTGLILCNVSALALSFLIGFHESIVWVFVSLVAFGISLTVSVMMAWTDKHVGLKGFVGVIFATGASLGQIVLNPVVGYLLDNVGYMYLMYVLLITTALCLIIIIALQILGTRYLKALAALRN